MNNQSSTLKHRARMLAECELFGTPEQYKEQAAQLRRQFGKSILKKIIWSSQMVVGSYQANMAKAFSRPTALRELGSLGRTANQMEGNGYDKEF